MICNFYKHKDHSGRILEKIWFSLKLSYWYRDIDLCMGGCKNVLIERQVDYGFPGRWRDRYKHVHFTLWISKLCIHYIQIFFTL